MNVQNPSDSEVSVIAVEVDDSDETTSNNSKAPSVTYEPQIDYVEEITIYITSTLDQKLPKTGVRLAILACVRNETLSTKPVVETSKLSSS